jgi:hypothetical protein
MDKRIFKHPFTMCVAGSTCSGKTEWIMRFLKNLPSLIDPIDAISFVYYCYGELNQNVFRLQNAEQHLGIGQIKVKTHNGVPDMETLQELARQTHGRMLLILDDLMIGLKSDFLDVISQGLHTIGG